MELKISKETKNKKKSRRVAVLLFFVVVYANGANLVHFNTIKQKI